MNEFYEYKGKRYEIFSKTKIKINGVWVDGIIYVCRYENPDGMIWVRTAEEFFKLFKKVDESNIS
jgi:hypothetical protein